MDIATDSFEEEVLQASSAVPVLVDFWAPWCAPCRALGPILEKLEREYGGRFKLVKVNLDDNPELARTFDVRSIPAVFAFRNGKPVANFFGAQPESQLRAFIDRLLPSVDEKKIEQASGLIEQGKTDEAERLLGEVRPNIDWDARVDALRAAIGFARSGGNEAELKAKVAANPDDLEAARGRSPLPRSDGPAARDRTQRQAVARRRGATAAAAFVHPRGGGARAGLGVP
jgi:putative thioredoxin